MDTLDSYLRGEYVRDRSDVARLLKLSDQAMRTLGDENAFSGDVWRYELSDRPDRNRQDPPSSSPPPTRSAKISHSTTAMIAFALDVAAGRVSYSPLVPAAVVRRSGAGSAEARLAKEASNQVQSAVDAVVADALRAASFQTKSTTFGRNDPFTLTWLVGLGSERIGKGWNALQQTAVSELQRVFSPKRTTSLGRGSMLSLGRGKTAAHEVPHAFATVRFIHLLRATRRSSGLSTDLEQRLDAVDQESRRNALGDRVHLHLSLSSMPGSAFDPADMVLALEGFQLLGEPDLALVHRVFDVLANRQDTSEYWRPLLPFTATEKGVVLLPQSTEIANSLLRICDRLYGWEPTLFGERLPLFRRYALWLESRAHHLAGDKAGWESEHTYNTDRIHLWQTSQALLFLRSYVAMLQRHMADTSLGAAGLVAEIPRDHETTARPSDRGYPAPSYDAKALIERDVIKDDLIHSLILSGPPGTGKSSLADLIAHRRKYRRITITTSDFAAAGQEGMEARAKAIFTTLALQAKAVVLFDEIDQLLLDRASEEYKQQADVFKLMTPGMLTKINDLVGNPDNIYILATNFVDRIDPAITRPGRFDGQYVVLPPAWTERVNHVLDELNVPAGDASYREPFRLALEKAGLYTYRDLKMTAARTARRHAGSRADTPAVDLAKEFALDLEPVKKLIALEAYEQRCVSKNGRARQLAQVEAALVAAVLFEPLARVAPGGKAAGSQVRPAARSRTDPWVWAGVECPGVWFIEAVRNASMDKMPEVATVCGGLLRTLEPEPLQGDRKGQQAR